MKNKPLNRFEAFAQRLIEGSFYKLFGEQSLAERMGQQLAEAVEAHQVNGRLPERLSIFFAPHELQTAVSGQGSLAALEREFYDAIVNLSQTLHLEMPKRFRIRLLEDAALEKGAIRAESVLAEQGEQSTQVHQRPYASQANLEAIRALNAFVIVTGQKHILLDKPLITIGRSLENDIVLDAATISRKHAQIRWRLGRFVLVDLSKRGRTVVNGVRVSEHMLEPGDVIALSHLMLIYGEEHTRPNRVQKRSDDDASTRPMGKVE